MKKQYIQPEIELIIINKEDISTADASVIFDPQNILGGNADEWF